MHGRLIPLYIYVNNDLYKANRYKIDRFIGLLPSYIKALESKFGAYQGESLGFILENVGDSHGEAAFLGAIETKDRPFFTTKTVVSENTFVHEFVHQWYGDAVRIENWDSLWLDFKEYNLKHKELAALIDKANLWLDDGIIFGKSGRGYQRININIATQKKNIVIMLNNLYEVFKDLK